MRAIWKGAVAFGLVNVPVKVYTATEDHDLPMHQVHNADGGRIRYQRRCEICGRVVEFVPAAQIDSIRLDRSYYLEPDAKSPRSYMLMRKVLEDTERVAVVQFTLRQKTRLGVLRVHGKVLLLQSLLWDDEVREADFPSLDADVRIQQREVDMATSLVQSFESDFSPADFTDEYQVQLKKLVDAKLEQGESVDTEATFGKQDEDEGDGEVIDLMEALKRSVEANRAKTKPESGSSRKRA